LIFPRPDHFGPVGVSDWRARLALATDPAFWARFSLQVPRTADQYRAASDAIFRTRSIGSQFVSDPYVIDWATRTPRRLSASGEARNLRLMSS
jgi:hypothetical protein